VHHPSDAMGKNSLPIVILSFHAITKKGFTEITAELQHITMRDFRSMANYLTFRQDPKFAHFT